VIITTTIAKWFEIKKSTDLLNVFV